MKNRFLSAVAGSLVSVAGHCGMGLALVGVGVALTLPAQVAEAQEGGGRRWGGGGGGGGMFQTPAISGQQILKLESILGLTADQMSTAKTLHEGYQDQVRQAQEKVREQMEGIRKEFEESQDMGVWDKAQKIGTDAREARKLADASFQEDIKLILTPQQAEKWPAAERAIRRDVSLRRGFVSGERVDLVRLVDDMKLPEAVRAPLAPSLEQYENEIDREILKRDSGMETRMKEMSEIRASGDFEKMQDVIEKGRQDSVRLRDVNRKYSRLLSDQLPEDQRSGFETAFKKESFPEVYRETYAARTIGAVEKFEDLNEVQKSEVERLKTSYDKRINPLNEELAAAVEEAEMTFQIGQGMGRDRGPVGELRRERRELEESTLESLKKVLKPEQVERLPKQSEEEMEAGRQRGGGGGERRRREQN